MSHLPCPIWYSESIGLRNQAQAFRLAPFLLRAMGKENGQHYMDEDSAESTKATTEPPAKNVRSRPNRKSQGELTELAFMHKAASKGMQLAKPWGDNGHYDLIVDSGQML